MNCPIHEEVTLKVNKSDDLWGYCKKCDKWYQNKDHTW